MNTMLLLAVQQGTAPDTVVAIPARDALGTVHTVAVIFLAATVLALLLVFLAIALKLRQVQGDVRRLLGRAGDGLDPVMDRARSVAENVDFVSHAIRNDVEELAGTVDRMRRRLERASDRMEERVEEFNALMDVVQSEAEEIFVDTASTVRGVREGSRSLAGRKKDDVDGRGE